MSRVCGRLCYVRYHALAPVVEKGRRWGRLWTSEQSHPAVEKRTFNSSDLIVVGEKTAPYSDKLKATGTPTHYDEGEHSIKIFLAS